MILSKPNWRDNFIGLYSFSKTYCAPGHRVGAVTAGEAAIAQLAKVMDNLQICAPRAPQAALARAIRELAGWREENRTEIARRADALRTAFASLPGWDIDAMGAFFAYVRHPHADGAEAVSARLAEENGVVTLPGPWFGVGQERYLRLAFANAGVDEIALLAQRLAD